MAGFDRSPCTATKTSPLSVTTRRKSQLPLSEPRPLENCNCTERSSMSSIGSTSMLLLVPSNINQRTWKKWRRQWSELLISVYCGYRKNKTSQMTSKASWTIYSMDQRTRHCEAAADTWFKKCFDLKYNWFVNINVENSDPSYINHQIAVHTIQRYRWRITRDNLYLCLHKHIIESPSIICWVIKLLSIIQAFQMILLHQNHS